MNICFIDAQNLLLATRYSKPSWEIDLRKFRIYLKEKYNISKCYYFVGAKAKAYDNFYKFVENCDYTLMFREHINSAVSKKKGNVDTDIVFEIFKNYLDNKQLDKIILVSGDGDYYRTVDYLIKKEKLLKILLPAKKNTSSLYKSISIKYKAFIDDNDVKRKIIRKEN
jgi:uncharacterized LabA/DUF88 family protein